MKKKSAGRKFTYEDPIKLKEDADKYFEWCDSHPIRGARVQRTRAEGKEASDDLFPRPYTYEGLGIYIGIHDFAAFIQNNREREGFADVFDYIRAKIRQNQTEGALVGIYNPSITARLNGLAEQIQVTERPRSVIVPTFEE